MVRVGVGTPAQTQLSSTELPRQSSECLSGIRCLAVQPQAPDVASLVAMGLDTLKQRSLQMIDGSNG